ncbi:MAG: hypothetical protein R3D97_04700 [Paracoccaceae bacterium]
MRVFMTILSIVLFLIAALAGGCSVVFAPLVFGGGGYGAEPIWIGGFVLCGLCIWAGRVVWRKR